MIQDFTALGGTAEPYPRSPAGSPDRDRAQATASTQRHAPTGTGGIWTNPHVAS